MRKIRSIMAFLTAMTITIGAAGFNAYADETDVTPEQEVTEEQQLDEEPEQIDEDDDVRIVDPADVISRYILDNEVDAIVSQRDGYVEVDYLDNNAKTAIEKFVSEKGYDKKTLKLSEMSERDKCRFVLYYKLIRYMEGRKYHATAYMKKNKDGTFSIVVNYYLIHEDYKDMVAKYLSEKGYDKQVKIEYEFIGDKNYDPEKDTMVRKRDKIGDLLGDFVKSKGLHCQVSTYLARNIVQVEFDDYQYQKKEEPVLREYMTKNHIDQSIVCIFSSKVTLEELDSPDLTIANEDVIYWGIEDYAEKEGLNVEHSSWAPDGCRPDHDYLLVRYLFRDERIKLEEYAEKMGYEKALIDFGYMNQEDTVSYVAGKIHDFIRKNKIKGYVKYNNDSDMCIVYRDTDADVRTSVEKFMKDNRYDTTGVKIEFKPVSKESLDTTKQVTDRDAIFILLKEFFKENGFSVYSGPFVTGHSYYSDNSKDDGKNYLNMTVYYEDYKKITEALGNFIKENNLKIDELSIGQIEGFHEVPSQSTLMGDADLNNLVELADLTTVAKYVLSPKSYPLTNEVAFANADMNNDGDVNGIDISMLIEQQLGKKHSEPVPEPTPEPSTEPATEPSTEPVTQPSTEVTAEPIPVPVSPDKTVELSADLKPLTIQSAKPSSSFSDSQINFAVDLLKNTAEEKTNTLVSPYSAVQALGMTTLGANGDTLKEMMGVIGGGMDISSFNKQMAGFKNNQPDDEKCKLLTANSIWYTNDSRFTIEKDFILNNKSYYDAQIFSAPMNDSTVKDVNSWVSEHTDKMIPNIIDKFDPDIIMALVNAVTFDAKWETPFEDSYKIKDYFKSADGMEQDADVLSETGYMSYLKDSEATGIMKKYEGGKYAFAAILPNEGTSADDYVKGLTSKKFKGILSTAKDTMVTATMPKFKSDYKVLLNDTLKTMGIKQAFDAEKADFRKMGVSTDGNISISSVIQKTFIEVDEAGTKAAAATIVQMCDECVRISDTEINLNRPFVYAIVDTETNIPIFIGTLNTLE